MLALATALPAVAQDRASDRAQEDLARDAAVLKGRDREVLHPLNNPLKIVGREQGDNGFRDRVPALDGGTFEPVKVDTDALHRRALAMYGGSAPFTGGVPRATRRTENGKRLAPPDGAGGRTPGTSGEEDGEGFPLVPAGLALLLGGLLVRRLLQ
jgi:hypothetical protein